MKYPYPLILVVIVLLVGLAACAPAPQDLEQPAAANTALPLPSTPLTFMAGYKPQANLPFVGVYVAKEKGYFAAEGLDVTIQHSPGKGEHLQLLAAGKIQVTTQDAGVLLQRRADPGLPLVSFALIGQRGQQAFAALAGSGMATPKDWEGHTVGYKGSPPPDLFALIKAAGADVAKVEMVNVGFDPRVLTEGQVDVYPLYKSNEPFLIQQWGYHLTLWDPADYGVAGLGLAYVTSDEILQTQPETLARFLRAALKGIEFASHNQDEAVAIVMKYAGPETNPEHMRFMLDAELKDAHSAVTDRYGPGWQTFEQWQSLAGVLADAGLPVPQDINSVFTTKILEMASHLP